MKEQDREFSVSIRVTEKERDDLKTVAAHFERTASGMVRWWVRRALVDIRKRTKARERTERRRARASENSSGGGVE